MFTGLQLAGAIGSTHLATLAQLADKRPLFFVLLVVCSLVGLLVDAAAHPRRLGGMAQGVEELAGRDLGVAVVLEAVVDGTHSGVE